MMKEVAVAVAVTAVAKATDMERVAEVEAVVARVVAEVAVAGTLCNLSTTRYHTQHVWFARPRQSTARTERCMCWSGAGRRANPLTTGGMSRAN